ncbi:MAG TPA: hypothetical protein VED46_11470 [Alphaproteobacteria bacterium]|nr:hypothetical protein [Alphaproteobacteria bacterium]
MSGGVAPGAVDVPSAWTCWARRVAHLLLILIALAACTRTHDYGPTTVAARPAETARILLMPPDIELYLLTASGLVEPRADWTAAAKDHVGSALDDLIGARDANLIAYQPPQGDLERERQHTQLVKLHEAVGNSILLHQHSGFAQLPGKKGQFDWTLGTEAAALQRDFGADYALFVFLRDSYSSAGRTAMIIGMAVLGIGMPGGQQQGFASLVDLKTGDIVWFNVLFSETLDLREREPARKSIETLLEGIPL